MTKSHWALATIAVSATLATTIMLTATAGAAASTGRPNRTMTLYGTALTLPNDGFVDVDHSGQPSGGDVFLDADVLRDSAHQQVGIDRGTCTLIRVDQPVTDTSTAENHCVVTAELNDGAVTFQGIEHITNGSVDCAITGGTGRYDGATGSVLVTLHDNGESSTLTFHFLEP
jgi:hypothetical protein